MMDDKITYRYQILHFFHELFLSTKLVNLSRDEIQCIWKYMLNRRGIYFEYEYTIVQLL